MNPVDDTSGVLDEAFERLHTCGPERLGRLTNHAPMVAEALAARGRSGAVHRWLDGYAHKLEDFPVPVAPIADTDPDRPFGGTGPGAVPRAVAGTDADWRLALGDPRRAADWIAYFGRALAERPWKDVLAQWWPLLLPGMYGGSTHPVIRVGHAVRALDALDDTGGAGGRGGTGDTPGPGRTAGPTAPRLAELAHGLGYWAARHHPVPAVTLLPGVAGADAGRALEAVPALREPTGGFPARLALVDRLPQWAGAVTDPDTARARLAELVSAATHRYATHGHGDETMLVHAATAPNAVLRALPALPRELWAPSLHAAWTAAAAVTAMYAPDAPVPYAAPGAVSAEDVLERALAHGDEHVIKLTDTALDVGDESALAAALRAIEISEPLG